MEKIKEIVSKKLNHVLLVIGIIILIYFLIKFDFNTLRSIDTTNLFVILIKITIVLFAYFIVRAIRWKVLLKNYGIDIPFSRIYLNNTIALSLASYTPAQTGEIIKLQLIKNADKIKRRKTAPPFVIEKFLDLITILIFFIIGAAIFKKEWITNYFPMILITVAVITLITALLVRFLLKKYPKISDYASTLKINTKTFISTFIITVISWLLVILNWTLVSNLIGVSINFLTMIFINSVTALIIIISLIPGALGFMELSNSYLFSNLAGVDMSQGILFALLIRLYTIFALIIGFAHILIAIKKQRSKAQVYPQQ